jgi:dUTP pyrophosphatase
LVETYKDHIKKHNDSLKFNLFPNAGFDLFVPEHTTIPPMGKQLINLYVKCEMIHCKLSTHSLIDKYGEEGGDAVDEGPSPLNTVGTSSSSGFYLYPRSSITKTDLMMTNHVGIIDSGYRGYLMASVRNLGNNATLEPMTRLFQICHPTLCPVYVVLVETEAQLTPSDRGTGGFGSTGISGATKA